MGPQTTKSSILEHILVYTNSIATGLASRGTLKHQKPGEITYPSHIWVIFFSCSYYYMSAYVDTINVPAISIECACK